LTAAAPSAVKLAPPCDWPPDISRLQAQVAFVNTYVHMHLLHHLQEGYEVQQCCVLRAVVPGLQLERILWLEGIGIWVGCSHHTAQNHMVEPQAKSLGA
jgi:hypothetical protein